MKSLPPVASTGQWRVGDRFRCRAGHGAAGRGRLGAGGHLVNNAGILRDKSFAKMDMAISAW
jgi:hypothetical protein